MDIAGHAMFRYVTRPTLNKYIGINENEFAYKKKQNFDDYLIQKDYFKNKKENKENKRMWLFKLTIIYQSI